MFFRHEISHYPVDVVLDEDIAVDIDKTEQTITCDTLDEFNDLLFDILNSNKVQRVVNTLYAAALREIRSKEEASQLAS